MTFPANSSSNPTTSSERSAAQPVARDYSQLKDSLERLKATVVTTSIPAKRSQKSTMFSLIDGWEDLIDSQTKESRASMISVSDPAPAWSPFSFSDGGLLAIDPGLFLNNSMAASAGFYRVARKHAGGNGGIAGFSILMPTLFEKSGRAETWSAASSLKCCASRSTMTFLASYSLFGKVVMESRFCTCSGATMQGRGLSTPPPLL